jgi:hypothetical protein
MITKPDNSSIQIPTKPIDYSGRLSRDQIVEILRNYLWEKEQLYLIHAFVEEDIDVHVRALD